MKSPPHNKLESIKHCQADGIMICTRWVQLISKEMETCLAVMTAMQSYALNTSKLQIWKNLFMHSD
ncbi:MAG: hypothetical protein FJ356_04275 [Thaumarchaeota archaeon]|nr:hypothetical protein [Nitrososphaerota archaeon]